MKREELNNEDFRTKMEQVSDFLKDKVATGSMIEQGTGVHHKSVTWIKCILEESGNLWEVYRGPCKVTKRMAWYLTTNPELRPPDNQCKLDFPS